MGMKLTKLKAEFGELPTCAWPGCYPILYIATDGGTFCADCANGKNESDARLTDGPNDAPHDGWRLEGYEVFFEGPSEFCVHCGAEIASAYGDPNAPEPPCALAMGCLCACHAAGLDASEPCDTSEERARKIAEEHESC